MDYYGLISGGDASTSCFCRGLAVFPGLGGGFSPSIIYNQITRKSGPGPIFYYALLFGGVIAALEYPLEVHTALIHYEKWSWFTSFFALSCTFLNG